MTNKNEIVIIGAGIAGLGAALKARESGYNYIIFEARKSAGGLLDNLKLMGLDLIMLFTLVLQLSLKYEKFSIVLNITHTQQMVGILIIVNG